MRQCFGAGFSAVCQPAHPARCLHTGTHRELAAAAALLTALTASLWCCLVPCVCLYRQVEVLIQELVVLVQRSEEYTYFLTSHMRDAVARDTEKQQAAAAAAAQRLSRRLSVAQPDTPAARDQKGLLLLLLVVRGACVGCDNHSRRSCACHQQQWCPSCVIGIVLLCCAVVLRSCSGPRCGCFAAAPGAVRSAAALR